MLSATSSLSFIRTKYSTVWPADLCLPPSNGLSVTTELISHWCLVIARCNAEDWPPFGNHVPRTTCCFRSVIWTQTANSFGMASLGAVSSNWMNQGYQLMKSGNSFTGSESSHLFTLQAHTTKTPNLPKQLATISGVEQLMWTLFVCLRHFLVDLFLATLNTEIREEFKPNMARIIFVLAEYLQYRLTEESGNWPWHKI